jgi:hypothetical protein
MANQHNDRDEALERVLGYLNFSSGATDPKVLATLNLLWADHPVDSETPTWRWVGDILRQRLEAVADTPGAFADSGQATAILGLVFDRLLPEYREFHSDLLFHQTDDQIFNEFFIGRACEAVLRQGPAWDDEDTLVGAALAELNDFVGFRPVPVLESRKIDPYPHERIRPIPLYVRDVGLAVSPYQLVVERALKLLEDTDESLLRRAHYDSAALDELAFDPRAYDFDHPANKRPNYHFGLWDPMQIDNQGRFCRFVVQQVTLDALMHRIDDASDLPDDELIFEASAVLAGTILMAAGVSGSGPGAHDSTTTLSNLLPRIARYRDEFYEGLMDRASPAHAERLREEAVVRRQPFGAARQHLNAQLARRRAAQLEHVQLAKLFARMGYPDAAADQARIVPAASARMLCSVDCHLAAVRRVLDSRDLEGAASLLDAIVLTLKRGIECGAIVDPWNILGFDAQFSLFPALENSVHDHRVDELVDLVEEILGMYSRAWNAASAADNGALCERISKAFDAFANWWRQYAPHTVSNIVAVDPLDAYLAAEHVAGALHLWHKGGAATGDIGFWAPHADIFDSPQAYALVIEALFEQSDYVATRGLLMHWLCESDRVRLEHGENSFHRLAERWIVETCHNSEADAAAGDWTSAMGITVEQWASVKKFFDFMEANADEHWEVPTFEIGAATADPASDPLELTEPEDEDGIYRAAYEDVVFRDSADDGIEGEIVDGGQSDEDGLGSESERLIERLSFLNTLARLWRITALAPLTCGEDEAILNARKERFGVMRRWVAQANHNRQQLMRLMDAVQAFKVPPPLGDHDSMVEYDRRRVIKESLLERIISTTVETAASSQLLAAASAAENETVAPLKAEAPDDTEEERLVVEVLAAMFRCDLTALDEGIDGLIEALAELPLLYVPLAKGGVPRDLVAVRVRQRWLQDLLKCLPRLGFFVATCRLIETARDMERNNPVGPGAVTEFDELYKIGFKSLVHALVSSSETWRDDTAESSEGIETSLVARLEQLTEAMLVSWLAHSRTLRLSVLEKANDKRSWKNLKSFIELYGGDLFDQRFLNIGNIRAILHQGVEPWLTRLQEELDNDVKLKLLDDLDRDLPRADAVESMTLVLEAIVENYGEYRDYNSTTTQSDRGEMLYTLLDFLRLRARYDRVCWNLKPVVMAHEILVRRRRKRAAQTWRRALRDRIGQEADKFQQKLSDLQSKYAMQMPSVADRIAERFVRPMVIDRICSLVQPAVDEAPRPESHPTFRILCYEIEFLTREPSGVGFDVPAWLIGLEDEVHRVGTPPHERDDYDELSFAVPTITLSEEEIEEQLDDWNAS